MDTRIALKNNTLLKFNQYNQYIINKEIGRGATSIVYDASYTNNTGNKKTVRIKECYPFKLDIQRIDSGELITNEQDQFNEYKQKMIQTFKISNQLFEIDGLTNSVSNTIDIYQSNNTVYIVSTYLQGETLNYDNVHSIKECISIIKSTAKAILKIHNHGYLYLDIKPENIYILEGTTEIIQLFDFDSLIPLDQLNEDFKISYTKGFAPLEQQLGQIKRIGKYSDVYGIGSLLFYLLFKRTPTALDCDYGAKYDYSLSQFDIHVYQDCLFYELTDFFHKTLANYYPDRYQDISQLILKLDKIEKYADQTIPFIISSSIPKPPLLIGRDKELQQLDRYFQNDCVFVSGMGGIGKSSLVKEYVSMNHNKFDSVIYVDYSMYDSMQDLIIDDNHISINTIHKLEEETKKEYYQRKLHALRMLLTDKKVVLVIDNYSFHNDLKDILELHFKIILVSRQKPPLLTYPTLYLNEIDHQQLFVLFQSYLGRQITNDETIYLNNIIDKIQGHTLVLELLARQIASSYISIQEASQLVDQYGFSHIAKEKIDYTKDENYYYDTIENMITVLFDMSELSQSKKMILKTLSLFHHIDIHIFSNMLELENKNDINELERSGWINIDNFNISMHPVIKEVVSKWDWTLYQDSLHRTYKYLIQQLEGNEYKEGKYKIVQTYVLLAKDVLESIHEDTYEAILLMYHLIINVARDQEEYILLKANQILNYSQYLKAEYIMNIYEKLIDIYGERREYNEEKDILDKAKVFAFNMNDSYILALYYDLSVHYYDDVLEGYYLPQTKQQEQMISDMLYCEDKAIYYYGLVDTDMSKVNQINCMISKTIFLIRNQPENKTDIDEQLKLIDHLIHEYPHIYNEIKYGYHMAQGWYYTYVVPDYQKMCACINKEYQYIEDTSATLLDFIDKMIIPYANMAYELGENDHAILILNDGIHRIEVYDEYMPYIREIITLYSCLIDIYMDQKDFIQCQNIIDIIDDLCNKNHIDTSLYITNELRDYIQAML
ncbi:MAG: NB-ARC domain-containing protein [Erysipelotrichaceae bacterium]|nr:NB-ARC domain-containing protein [Erysipelotrichaceae bacterium]